ncbi:hypothetical protein [Pendulispora albinea]|uniref:Uncharacterized protein n=1 Tax=Pendulispora albinea TaxID=2741071 RepID=A0ABZ2M843_9BACT
MGGMEEAGLSPFCRSLTVPVALCRDFDDDRPFSADFTVEKSTTDTLMVDSTRSLSSPRALVSEVAPNSDSRAFMHRKFDGIRSSDIRLSFHVFIEVGAKQAVRIAQIDAQQGTRSEHSIEIYASVDGARLTEQFVSDAGVQNVDHEFAGFRPEVGRWAHIDILISGSTRRLTAVLDGHVVVDQKLRASWTPEETELALGVIFPNTGSPWRVWYDNIIYQLF